ncbi:MAG: hypothetical protein IH588_06825 [Anaerolineales bacterium]|nr:hypothetical protein [Anaerolineales bacterium]
MNNRLFILLILPAIILTSCQAPLPPPPITAAVNEDFILRPGQSAAIDSTDLTIQLIAISGDERCPLKIECAMSGPVTLTIFIQKGDDEPAKFNLQTFTDNTGRAPEMSFEGIQDRVEYEGYVFRIKSVMPYPVDSMREIRDSDYRVSFVVTSE